jgi:hypothetical protein
MKLPVSNPAFLKYPATMDHYISIGLQAKYHTLHNPKTHATALFLWLGEYL